MNITFEQLLSFSPCMTYRRREYVLSLTEGRDEIEMSEIADLPIPERDKVWLLLKVLGTVEDAEKKQRLFACDRFERVLFQRKEAGREPDASLWDAIHVGRVFARGRATKEELRAAWDAASATYYDEAYAAYSSPAIAAAHAAFAEGRMIDVNKLLEYIGV